MWTEEKRREVRAGSQTGLVLLRLGFCATGYQACSVSASLTGGCCVWPFMLYVKYWCQRKGSFCLILGWKWTGCSCVSPLAGLLRDDTYLCIQLCVVCVCVCVHMEQQDLQRKQNHVWTMRGSNRRAWRMWCKWLRVTSTCQQEALMYWGGGLSWAYSPDPVRVYYPQGAATKFSLSNVGDVKGFHVDLEARERI